VNLFRRILIATLLLWAAIAAAKSRVYAVDLLPSAFRELTPKSTAPESWPRLRSYAQSQKDSEWRGWAYFLTGYREFEAQHYSQAAQDLSQAAESGFSLADYAVFYQATALSQSNQPQQAAVALQDFKGRFPRSNLRARSLELRARALLEAQQAPQAVDALAADPEASKQPALALLLAQALSKANKSSEAVTAFQNVYYNFPMSVQAKTAFDSLPALRSQLGIAYKEPDVGLRRSRAESLYRAARYDDSLNEFGEVVKDEPSSVLAPYCQLGQAKCLLRLHRGADALRILATHFGPPDLEAQRLGLLLQVHAQQEDASAMAQDLAQLDATYALYPAYADALSAAGMFYYRQLNWQEAATDYRRLVDLFPRNEHLRDDGWRLAWCDYILGDPKTAEIMTWYLRQFPDSARAPSALYWLGRLEENQASPAEARALYLLLQNRFAHTYYEKRAGERLAALRLNRGGGDSGSAPLLATDLASLLPRPVARIACQSPSPSEITRPPLVLRALNLKDLEEEFLKTAVARDNSPAELRLLLAQVYDDQKKPASALFCALKASPDYPQLAFSDLPEEIWNYLYPRAYGKLIEGQAHLRHLDPYLVMGLIRQESAYSPLALSVSNARGLMQVLPETAARTNHTTRTRLVGRRLYDPAYNVRVGCVYLAGLLKDFDNRPDLAMAAYHAGDFRVRDWQGKSSFRDPAMFVESIPIPATRTYVELVLRDAQIYRELLSGSPHFAPCTKARSSAPARVASPKRGTTSTGHPSSRTAPPH
jgi:soluble lytic murein transglycosylase